MFSVMYISRVRSRNSHLEILNSRRHSFNVAPQFTFAYSQSESFLLWQKRRVVDSSESFGADFHSPRTLLSGDEYYNRSDIISCSFGLMLMEHYLRPSVCSSLHNLFCSNLWIA